MRVVSSFVLGSSFVIRISDFVIPAYGCATGPKMTI
jgi:hypothetical protein